jgi:hypothetical protein
MTDHAKPSGIVVQIGTATVRMRPVGFALYAHEFFIAGASIPENSRSRGNTKFTPVPYYLFCRALELILKAYLLAEDPSLNEQKLKKSYGHDLEALWREAKKHRLMMVLGASSTDFERDLKNANAYYKAKAFEYFDFSRWAHNYEDLPPFARFRDEVERIVEETKKYCVAVS